MSRSPVAREHRDAQLRCAMTSAVSDLPDPGVTDNDVLERHRRFIESVAEEMRSSVQDIEPLYAEVIETLSANARVPDYLPIFAYRRAREISKSRSKAAPAGLPTCRRGASRSTGCSIFSGEVGR
jgi:hypothetical protein